MLGNPSRLSSLMQERVNMGIINNCFKCLSIGSLSNGETHQRASVSTATYDSIAHPAYDSQVSTHLPPVDTLDL